ncbi:MAG TPA: zinc-ribbon domain containing protein [Candidatus Dormibacteraeota bacterium]|nr:zinc-ribbon domain containing protein [Candidatus Dormibacteraeota bacterium]
MVYSSRVTQVSTPARFQGTERIGSGEQSNPKRLRRFAQFMYTDETLTCVDCGQPFPFTSGEQEFFAMKGFTNKPSRCTECRSARKAGRSPNGGGGGGGGSRGGPREMFKATCSQCGGVAEVPFQPRGDKPVYCRDCFATRRAY